jgi:hypothetical protein
MGTLEDVQEADLETQQALSRLRVALNVAAGSPTDYNQRDIVSNGRLVIGMIEKEQRLLAEVKTKVQSYIDDARASAGPTTLRLGSAMREVPMYECPLCNVRFSSTEEVHRHAESYEHRQQEALSEGLNERESYPSQPPAHCAHPVVDWNKAVCMSCGAPVNLPGHPIPPSPTIIAPCPSCNTGPINLKRGPRNPNCTTCGGTGMVGGTSSRDRLARARQDRQPRMTDAPPAPDPNDRERIKWRRQQGLE